MDSFLQNNKTRMGFGGIQLRFRFVLQIARILFINYRQQDQASSKKPKTLMDEYAEIKLQKDECMYFYYVFFSIFPS